MKQKNEETEMKKIRMSQQIRSFLENGTYLPGSALPSEREMAEEYGISRMAVKSVLKELAEDGYIYRIQGKGTFVQKRIHEKTALGVLSSDGRSFSEVMKRQGIHIENRVIAKGKVPMTSLLKKRLQLEEPDEIYGLYRIRMGNGIPYAVELTYLPLKYFPEVDKRDFAHVSLYSYMEAKGFGVKKGPQTMCVVPADDYVANYLELEVGQPVYRFEFCGKTKKGEVVEYTESYTRTDRTEIRIQDSFKR